MKWNTTRAKAVAVVAVALLLSCGRQPAGRQGEGPQSLSKGEGQMNLYSGREEELVGPIISRFEKETGIDVKVKYGSTSEIAATLLEEGERSPADMFLAQDAGALGAVSKQNMFKELPDEILSAVPAQFRSPTSDWVGITGRARTVVYNTEKLSEDDIPSSVLELADPKWKGRIGWAPTNGSFQAFVTALRKLKGDEAARKWLQDMKANNTKSFPSNAPIVQAVAAGEIDAGLVNHYYLVELKQDNPNLQAANHFFGNGDPGGLVNVSGAGILKSSRSRAAAERLLGYFLSPEGQRYWAGGEGEYPLLQSVKPAEGLPSLADLQPPDIKLSDLHDLEGTLKMLNQVGLT